jgi:hypothetical protein
MWRSQSSFSHCRCRAPGWWCAHSGVMIDHHPTVKGDDVMVQVVTAS